MDEIKVTISGKSYAVSRETIVNAMKGVQPQAISKYSVRVGQKRYPPKQVIAEALRLPPIAFTTQYAYNILQRLGFEVEQDG